MKFRLIKSIFTLCCLLLAVNSIAQSKYWGFQYSNTLVHNPGSTSTIPIAPLTPTDNYNPVAHTIYDEAGNVLFSATGTAIYDRAGNIVGGYPTGMYSEVEIFPSGTACGHYYLIFVSGYNSTGDPDPMYQRALHLWEVDASNPLAVTVTFVDHLADETETWGAQYLSSSNYGPIVGERGNGVGLVATAADKDNNRKLYMLSFSYDIAPGGPPNAHINHRFSMKCWTFKADGSYSFDYEEPLDFGGTLNPVPDHEGSGPGDKMNRVTIMEATPNGSQIAYGGPLSLKVFDTRSRTITTYPMPMLDGAAKWIGAINGIEYVYKEDQYRWYVSYAYLPAGATKGVGAIGYFDVVGAPINNVSLPTTVGASEIEYDPINKLLYFANCPTCPLPGHPGYYSDYFIIAGTSTTTPAASPGTLYSFDPFATSPTLSSVAGISVKQSSGGGRYYYLNNQIDGEDYSLWNGVSGVANADINDGISIPHVTPACSLGSTYGPLQVVDINAGLTLQFKNSSGSPVKLTMNEEYYISWVEVDECGVPLSPVVIGTHPWNSGSGSVNLKAYIPAGTLAGAPFFSTTACHNKYYGFTIEVHNKCTDEISTYNAFIKMQDGATECSADFMYQSYSFNPNTFQVFPIIPVTGSSYKVNWGDGSGFVSIASSHLYAPGNYTLCVKEYRDGVEFCTRCKDICVSGGTSTVPGETTCDFIYRSYSNVGRILEVIPYMMPAGVSISDYKVNWGDLTTPTSPASSHSYAADGSYTVCLSRYNLHPYSLICEKCINVCIGGGGGLSTARTTGIDDHKEQSFVSQLYPNPTSDQSVLQLNLKSENKVSVQIMDITGKLIQNVLKETLKKGVHNIEINTRSIPSGIYMVNTTVGAEVLVHKLHIIK